MNLSFSDGLQPAEKECLAETARSHATPRGTARGFDSAYQTLMVAPVPAAGLGAAVRGVSTASHTNIHMV